MLSGSVSKRRHRGLISSLAAVLLPALLGGAVSDAAANQVAISSGQAWLSANIGADATWRSTRDARGVRSTSRALLALGEAAPAASRQWLEAQTPFNLEETQEAALALRTALPEALLAPLTTQKSATGKWGASAGAAPSVYHTALALVTLAQSGRGSSADVLPGAAYLRSIQFLDGSWPAGEKGQETATITALAAHALSATDPAGSAQSIATARQWLLAHRNADGGWGMDGSATAVTSQVLYALRWLGCPSADEAAAVAYIVSQQQVDGSWEHDPWSTALAVSALLPAGLPDLAFTVGGVDPDGNPVPGDAWSISATVTNRGSHDAAPVAVRFAFRNALGESVVSQDKEVASLAPGATTEFSFTVPTAVTAALSGSCAWSLELDPASLVAEGDEADNHAEGSILVQGSRNLAVVPGSLSIYTADGLQPIPSDQLYVGTTVQVRAVVRCDGTTGAPLAELGLYRGDPAEGFLAAFSALADIYPGEERTVLLPWTVAAPTGSGFLTLQVDPRELVAQTDRSDDRADIAIVVNAEDTTLPEPPTGVTAVAEARARAIVSWTASVSSDVIGYRVYRDGVPINAVDLAPSATASASDSFNLREFLPEEVLSYAAFDPPNLNDGDRETTWWSIQYPYDEWEREPCFVEFGLPAAKSVRGVIVDWYNFDMGAADFKVQTWNGAVWSDAATVEGNIFDRSVVMLAEAVLTDKVRILVDKGIRDDFVAIREVSILEAGPGMVVAGTTFTDTTVTHLPVTYAVTAVDAAGNESVPSAPFVLGDVTPPTVVLTAPLPGQRVGPEVFLQGTVSDDFLQGYTIDWGEGAAPQGEEAWHRAGQRAEPVVNGPIFTWHPPADALGPYTVRVTAVDEGGVGNSREARVTVNVDAMAPDQPGGLAASVSGEEVTLTWAPNTEPDLAGYVVHVNNDPGYLDVTSDGAASASTSYADAYVDHLPGDALDGDPGSYWRPTEDSYPCWWAADFPAPQSVRRVTLSWRYPFVARRFRVETRNDAGEWSMRWSTDDNTKEQNEIVFAASTSVTAVRVTILEGKILGWGGENTPFGVVEPPAPYPALAEVTIQAENIVTETVFSTKLTESAEHGFTVTAVDDLGNHSSPSQALVVDLRGPRVAIIEPKAWEEIGRGVTITGWVADRYLKDYVVEVGAIAGAGQEPSQWEEIHRSMTPVAWGQIMTVWYPTFRKGWQVLRLTARDEAGFTSVARRDFIVDAMPPEPPQNLVASESGDDVTLSWIASTLEADGSGTAADLDGYRVYRNEIPQTVRDVSFLARVSAPTVDGCKQGFPSYAVDGLEESTWSPEPFAAEAVMTLDLPQPYSLGRVEILWAAVDWHWGRDYTIEAYDKAAGTWVTLADVTHAIWPRGDHSFAALVTDRVRITLTAGPTAYSLGSIAEIHLWRSDDADLVQGTSYAETVPADVEAAYRVTAVDQHGNESTKSNRVRLDRTPPRVAITSPAGGEIHSPAGTAITIKGTVDDPVLRQYKVELGTGDPATAWRTLAEQQGELTSILTAKSLATWILPDDVQGPYTIRLSALDEGNHRGETSIVVYVDTKPPATPTALVAAVEAGGVGLDWLAVIDSDLAGYHVYRNGKRLDLQDVAVNGEAKASSYYCDSYVCYPPEDSGDGNASTAWRSLKFQVPAWLRFVFDGFYPIERVAIEWDPWYLARDFTLETWDRDTESWNLAAEKTDLDANPWEITFDPPVRLEGLRVRMTGLLSGKEQFGIREVHLYRAPGAETPTGPFFFDDATGDLEYTYRVTAVDHFGNESVPSNEVQVDAQPPRVAVVSPVEGARVGPHVEISGTVADGRLLDYRLLVSKGEVPSTWSEAGVWERPVDDNVIAVWDPPVGENGAWWVRIEARDLSGQVTRVDRKVILDTTSPPVPSALSAALEGQSAVRLVWSAVTAADLATYRVYRHGELLNDPRVSPRGTASASYNDAKAGKALDGTAGEWTAFLAPYWWQETFQSGVDVSRIEIFWVRSLTVRPPRDYEFQVLTDGDWHTVLMVWDNAFEHRIHDVPVPENSTAFRVLITGPDRDDDTGREMSAGIDDVRFWDYSRAVPVLEPTYLDAGLTEIGWTYEVSAVDDLGNESGRSAPATADNQAPVVGIAEPADGTTVPGPAIIKGTAKDTNMAHWELKIGEGTEPGVWQDLAYGVSTVANVALAAWDPPVDYDGTWTLLLAATDVVGQRSEARATVRVLTKPPSLPLNLTATVGQGGAVALDWAPPEYGEIVGYNVYRNGEKLNRTDLAPSGTVEASTVLESSYPAAWTVDGWDDTIWVPEPFLSPSWLSVRFGQTHRIHGVSLSWYESVLGDRYQAADYQIQAWENDDWKTLVFVENNTAARRTDYFLEPVTTDGIRILMTSGNNEDIVGAVREFAVLSAEGVDLLTETSFVDDGLSLIEGVYTVTAVDAYGHESPAATVVADEVAPRVSLVYPLDGDRVARSFTILGSLQEGALSEVEVSWSQGGADWQRLAWSTGVQSQDAIASVTIPSAVSYEGPGTLRIMAVDQAGNVTDHQVSLTFDTVAPSPTAAVWAVPSGNAGAFISWSPVSAPDLLGYLVKRNGTTLNPGNLVEAAVASAPDVYLDSDHHQPWAAADTLLETAWWSDLHDGPKYLELTFPTVIAVNQLRYRFASSPFLSPMVPRDFHVEAMVDGAWQLLDTRVNWLPHWLSYGLSVSPAVSTDRIRFTATRGQEQSSFMIGVVEATVQGTGLVNGTSFTDSSLAAGECAYTVVSKDVVGNESQASAAAYVDAAGPRVGITAPAEGSLQGIQTRVAGTVQDPNQKTWSVAWGYGSAPSSWTTIIQGNQYNHSFDQTWTTTGIDGLVTLRLRAEDFPGNASETTVSLNVDGIAPTAPDGLLASPDEDGVRLSWDQNPESDIQGYLVFRDGKPLTDPDISSQGTAWASSEYVYHGRYEDIVYYAGNAADDNPTSCWRNDASVTEAVTWGVDFGEPFSVEGVSVDFNAFAVAKAVYVEGFRDGGWQVLATISDNTSSHRDMPFTAVAVTSLRLRFPALDGMPPTIMLSEVSIAPVGAQGPVADLSFRDGNIADISSTEHAWQVSAVDQAGNRGPLSDAVRLDTKDPRLLIDAPVDNALVGARVDVRGSVTDSLLSSWSLVAATGAGPEAEVASGTQGVDNGLLGTWEPDAGFEGQGHLILSATDAVGRNMSLTRTVRVDTVAPAAPATPSVDAGPEALTVCWEPPVDGDIAGYVVYRNGERLQAADVSGLGTMMSQGMDSPTSANDDQAATAATWHSSSDASWLGLGFATPHAFAAVQCDWRGDYRWNSITWAPSSFHIQVRQDGEWISVATVDGETRGAAEYRFDPPVVGDGIRILTTQQAYWGLHEIGVIPEETVPIAETCYRDRVLEEWGLQEASYQIAAVDQAGNEGPLSGETLLDATPPRVSISAPAAASLQPSSFAVMGKVSDALLDRWTLEGSLAGGPWLPVATGTAPVEDAPLATWSPTAGFKGDAVLRLTAVDAAGNGTNMERALSVDADPPGPPSGLQAEVAGADTLLTWNPSPEEDVVGYRVHKNAKPITGDITHMGTYTTLVGSVLTPNGAGAVSGYVTGPPFGVEARFDYRPAISQVVMNITAGSYAPLPANITLDTWDGTSWITAGSINDNTSERLIFSFSTPIESHRFRVLVHGDYPSYASFPLVSMTVSAPGQSVVVGTSFAVKAAAEHQDAYTVTAVDLAGNESAPSAAATVDQVAPVACITSPAPGSLVGSAYNVVGVGGTADDPFLDHWTLSWARGDQPTQLMTIATKTTPVPSGALANWTLPSEESDAVLHLEVADRSGHVANHSVAVRYDTLAPRASLNLAQRYWVPGEPQDITGLAEDANMATAALTVLKPGETKYTSVASWNDARNGILTTADTTGWQPGVALLQLALTDQVGRQGHGNARVNVASVRYLNEWPLTADGDAVTPQSAAVFDGKIWLFDGSGHIRRLGADGTPEYTAPGTIGTSTSDPKDVEWTAERVWMLGFNRLTPYNREGFALSDGVPITNAEGYAHALGLLPDGSPVVLRQTTSVSVFDPLGSFVRSFAIPETCADIAVDRFGMIYLLGYSGTIHVLDAQGTEFASFAGNTGRKLEIDLQGHVILGGAGDGKMATVLSPSGELLVQFGLEGQAAQEIYSVVELLGMEDRLVILDGLNRRFDFRPLLPQADGAGAPAALIHSPADGGWVKKGALVTGTVRHVPGTSWVLEIGQGDDPTSWATIGQGTGELVQGSLAPWDTREYADGTWTLRLTVTGDAGAPVVATSTVNVDNDLPTAEIASPLTGTAVLGVVAITGTADDGNLQSYTLVWKRAGETAETTIAQGTSPIVGGILGSWDATSLPTGLYQLMLTVTDRAGNVVSDQISISVGAAVYLGDLSPGLLGDVYGAGRLPDGRWVLVDQAGMRLLILSASGEILRIIPNGEGGLSLSNFQDLAVFPDGRFALLANSKVTVFDGDGHKLFEFGKVGIRAEEFGYATRLAVDRSGRIIVLNTSVYLGRAESVRYQVFSTEGAYLFSVGGYHADPGLFRQPVDIDTDGAGNVVVLDKETMKIQVFDPEGNLVQVISLPGELTGRSVKAMEVDDSGRMLVLAPYYSSTPQRDQLYLLAPDGAMLFAWGKNGTGQGLLQSPSALWFDGRVAAVADYTKDTLMVYDLTLIPAAPEEPTALMTSPAEGGMIGARVRLTGTAAGQAVTSYRILAGTGTDPVAWTEVAAETRQAVDGVLATVDLTSFASGTVTLRLVASGDGVEVDDRVTCVLDAVSPEAEILNLEDYDLLSEGAPIRIRVSDASAVQYSLSLDRDDRASYVALKVLAQGSGPVDDSAVAWNPANYPAGAYRLALTAVDAAGNRTRRSVVVSTGQIRLAGRFDVAAMAPGTYSHISRDGETFIYVTFDGVYFFDAQGNPTSHVLGSVNLKEGTSDRVLAIGSFPDGYVVLTRFAPHIAVYDRAGSHVRSFGDDAIMYQSAWGNYRVDLVDATGRILLRNYTTVKAFSLDGAYLGDVLQARSVDMDGAGNLYLLPGGSTVNVLSPAGALLTSFGEAGNQPWQFGLPETIAVDGQGHIAVDDGDAYYNQKKQDLSIWAPDGRFLGSTSGSGWAAGWLGSVPEVFWGSGDRVSAYRSNGIVEVFDASLLFPPAAAPTASFASPAEGTFRPVLFPVSGTALGGDSYTLVLEGPGVSLGVASGAATVRDGHLGTVDCQGLADGEYTIVLQVTGNGQTAEARRRIYLDSVSPAVSVTSPASFEVVAATFGVTGSASDAFLVSWKLELGTPVSNGTQWSVVAQGSSSVEGNLGTMDCTTLAAGTYLLRLSATDAAGHESSTEVVFNWGTIALEDLIAIDPADPGYPAANTQLIALSDGSLLYLTDDQKLVRTDVDGNYLGELTWTPPLSGMVVNGVAKMPGGLILECQRGSGFPYAVILSLDGSVLSWFELPYGEGPGKVAFNVRGMLADESRVFVLEQYEVEVFAHDGTWIESWGEAGTDPGELTNLTWGGFDAAGRLLLLDNGNRVQTFSSDGRFRGQFFLEDGNAWKVSPSQVALDGHGNLAAVSSYRGYVYRSDGELLRQFGGGNSQQPGSFQYTLGLAFDSSGRLWMLDRDGYTANDPCRFQVFSLDLEGMTAALGEVAVYSPAESGLVAGTSWIQGKITGVEPLSWSLDVGEGSAPSSWLHIAEGDQPIPVGVIAAWDAVALVDGAYTLRLAATDANGLVTEIRRAVILDATAPVVQIDSPENLQVLAAASVPISGGMADLHESTFALKYRGTEGNWPQQWWILSSGTGYPAGQSLGTWQAAMVAPDVYRLKAWALDGANNLTVADRDVSRQPLRYLAEARFTPDASGYVNAAASRDGRVAVVSADAASVSVLDEHLAAQQQIVTQPDAGWASFAISRISFAPEGDLVVFGKLSNSSTSQWKMTRYRADGTLDASYQFPTTATTGIPSDVTPYDMLALAGGRVAFLGADSLWSTTRWLKVFSFAAGLQSTAPAPNQPATEAVLSWSLAADPAGNLLLPCGSNDGTVKFLQVFGDDGRYARNEPVADAGMLPNGSERLAVDGSGCFYDAGDATRKVNKYSADRSFLWGFGVVGSTPGRFTPPGATIRILTGRQGHLFVVEASSGRVFSFETLDDSVDREGPQLGFDAALGSEPLSGLTDIRGTIGDPHLLSWTLRALPGGQDAGALTLGTGSGQATGSVLASWATGGHDGSWVLVLEASDTAGNTSRAEIAVSVLNLEAPLLDALAPLVNTATITVAGAGRPGATAHVSVNGGVASQGSLDGGGRFSLMVGPLAEGSNQISARLSDGQGHFGPSCAPVTVVADFTAPAIAIAPAADPFRETFGNVNGTRESGVDVALSVDTDAVIGAVTYPTATTWSFDVAGMADGNNTFVATATDAAGNTATAQSTVHVVLNLAPVLDVIGDRWVSEAEMLAFAVTATDPDGTVPVVVADPLPAGAAFDGTLFTWHPTYDQSGAYAVTFTATDGDLSASETIAITVLDVNRAPTVPVISAPRTQTEVEALQPGLAVENSVDPDGDALAYEYEVYDDVGLPQPVLVSPPVSEGDSVTSWTAAGELGDNAWYWWRARVCDGRGGCSDWTEAASFFVNSANDPPGPFHVSGPEDGADVAALTPVLAVTNSGDVDGDALGYSFLVCLDEGLTQPAASVTGLPAGAGGATGWTTDPPLSDNTWYYWKAVVTDAHGASAETGVSAFFVNLANDAPDAPEPSSPADGSELAAQAADLTVRNAADPEADPVSYLFELDTVETFDSPAWRSSGWVAAGADDTSWPVADLADNTLHHWRVKASDGLADSGWAKSAFFTNTGNDAPTSVTALSPGAESWVDSATPRMDVSAAADPDRDAIGYVFQVYGDPPVTPLAEGQTPEAVWVCSEILPDNAWYHWRAAAVDEHGLSGPWSAANRFFVNNNGIDDPPSITVTEPAADYALAGGSFEIRWEDADPDSAAAVSLYYDNDNAGEDGTPIVAGLPEDADGAGGDTYDWDVSALSPGRYWVYGVIADGTSTRASYSLGSVVIELPPVASAGPDRIGAVGQVLTFSAGASSDPDGSIAGYSWSWGDGTPDGAGVSATHAYAEPGTYTVTLTAIDDLGVAGADTAVVAIGAPAENLAANKPVTASSTRSGTDYVAAHAVDGSNASSWMSSSTYQSQWVRVDLGSNQSISYVKVVWPQSYYAEDFQVQTSSDGATFTTRYSVENASGTVTNAVFASVSARYVRVSCTKDSNHDYYGLSELEVYALPPSNQPPTADAGEDIGGYVGQALSFSGAGSADPDGNIVSYSWNWGDGTADGTGVSATHAYATVGTRTVTLTVTDNQGAASVDAAVATVNSAPVNLALNRPASASTTRSGSSYTAAGAIDGSTSTSWMSSTTSGEQWVQVDLGSSVGISSVNVTWPATYYAEDFQIETSLDGTNWTTRYWVEGADGAVTNASFAAVNARYVRVYCTKRTDSSYYGVSELEVYQ